MNVLFFHGLESGPHGSKYRALKHMLGEIESPDFQGLELEQRLAKAEEITRDQTDLILVGSSFGGLVAALLASRYPERVAGYVLCAPALHWQEANQVQEVPLKAAIIHGTEDEEVPVQASIDFAARWNVPLFLTHDDHRLKDSMEDILEAVRIMLADHNKQA